jgi:ABC-2 type transport system permease protein
MMTTTLAPTQLAEPTHHGKRSDLLRGTWIVFARAMRLSLRNPTWVIIGLTQPILYLVLFGPLLKPMAGLLGGNAWRVFVPGMLVQLGIFGGMFVGFGLIAEWRAGVIESMRVTPTSRLALLMGRVLRDVVVLVVQAILLTVVAVPLGLRAPFVGVVVAILVVGLLGAAFSSASYAVALTLKSEDALAPLLNGVAIPVLLLSGILLPMTLAPRWLRAVADVNPLKHVVDGLRAMFRGDLATSTSWWGLVATVALVVVGLWFGAHTFRRESA